MSILLSDVRNDVTVRNGTLVCQASSLGGLTVLELGSAQVSGCFLDALSTAEGARVSITGSTIDANASLRGQTVVSGVTDLGLQGAASWRAIDLFQVLGATVAVDVRSGSRIHALDRLWIALGQVTVGSGVEADSRIDVEGDLGLGNADEDSYSSGTLTIEDGGVVDVDGTLFIRPLATLNLDGGTLRVTNLVNEGTLHENGGTLIVPEAAGAAPALAAAAALAALGGRRARSRIA